MLYFYIFSLTYINLIFCLKYRFLHHLKKKIGNKARVEGSICNAYLTEEISNFCINYFESHIETKGKRLRDRYNSHGVETSGQSLPEIFSVNGYSPSEGKQAYLNERDYKVAHRYVLSNAGILDDYER